MKQNRIIVVDGVAYHADRPIKCRYCFYWKNKKEGCLLGKENCYYLAGPVLTKEQQKCIGCPYAKNNACVSMACYRKLEEELQISRQKKKEGTADEC